MKKLISLFQTKYEQVLLYILTRATEILTARYENKLKKNEKKVSVADYAKLIPQSKNSWASEELQKRKEKYETLKTEGNGRVKIKFIGENGSTKTKIDFPCEKLWQAVFGEQDKIMLQEYESKKYLLSPELQKLFKECKRINEVNETYRDLIFKNRFAKKVSDSISLLEEEKTGLAITILETRILCEIEKAKSERLDSLEKNTKTEIVKVCGCEQDCFCGFAERIVLIEDEQEIVLFDNVEQMKKHYDGSQNYEDLGLEIEEYNSEKKSTDKEFSFLKTYLCVEELEDIVMPIFDIDCNEQCFFLNEDLEVCSPTEKDFEYGRLMVNLFPFSDQQLEEGLKKILFKLSSNSYIRDGGTLIRQGNLSNILIRKEK